jgi:hypothetical protein
LADTALAQRSTEVFGYYGFALGFGCLFCTAGFALDPSVAREAWYVPAAIAGTLLGFGYEFVRRRSRLVFVPTGPGWVAAYRRGAFLVHARAAEFLRYRLRVVNTVREVMASAVVTLLATLGVVALDGSGRLFAMAAAVAGALALASAVYTRIVCKQYLLSPAQHEGEYVVLRRGARAQLGLA